MMTEKEYRDFMIKEIMERTNRYTLDELKKKSTKALEIIYDFC